MIAMSVLGVVFAAKSGEPLWVGLSLPFTALLLLVARRAPTGYRLDADGVRVERRAGGGTLIPYRTIDGVDREARPLKGLTLGGSQGIFGRFGRFWSVRLGFYRLFLSNRDGVVWLRTTGGLVGLSPDRPDEFVERLQRRLER